MNDEVKAIYENGVFRPLEPVGWSEQQQVTVRLSAANGEPARDEEAMLPQEATDENWTDEKNARRCDLIDKEIEGSITTKEKIELDALQKQAIAYRKRVAPLPMEYARKLHAELLKIKRQGVR